MHSMRLNGEILCEKSKMTRGASWLLHTGIQQKLLPYLVLIYYVSHALRCIYNVKYWASLGG